MLLHIRLDPLNARADAMGQQRYGLWNAPPEVINEISNFIKGVDVISLWLCGSKRLMYGMSEQGGVTRLLLKVGIMNHLISWPTIISQLKSLQVLGLDVGSQSIITGDPYKAMKTWPKSIRELRLSYRDSERVWSDMKNSSELFPNLEIVQLSGWGAFGVKAMQHLPPTVTTLNLRTNTALTSSTLREYLPRHILHLYLPCNDRFDSSCCPTLPETLLTLHVPSWGVRLDHHDIAALPRSLTDLSFRPPPDNVTATIRALPKGLKHLQLTNGFGSTTEFGLSSPLPETLLSFVVVYGTLKTEIKNLPRSLTRLECPTIDFGEQEIANLPQGLTTLCIEAPLGFQDGSALENLPQGITKLSFANQLPLKDDCIRLLPRGLRHLSLPGCYQLTGNCFADLPRGVCKLNLASITQVTDEQIAFLPPFLLKLNLRKCRFLTDLFAKSLPRGLKELIIEDNNNFTFSCVSSLPTHIDSLALGHNGVVDKYQIEKNKRSKRGTRL